MLAIVVAMLAIVVVAAAVVVYVAFPHRGEELPVAGWLGDAVSRAVEAVPIVEDGALDGSRVRAEPDPAEHPAHPASRR